MPASTEFAFDIVDVAEAEQSDKDSNFGYDDSIPRIWCEFCKGYYIEEYHYGRSEDDDD
jgi:hypothetical protein